MNILPLRLNVPAEVKLGNPEGLLVQGRYGDRVMFTLADGHVMYVPPLVADKIRAAGVVPGEPFQLCKAQVRKGNRRSIEWTVRRLDDTTAESISAVERDLRASIVAVEAKQNGNGDNSPPPRPGAATPEPVTKLGTRAQNCNLGGL